MLQFTIESTTLYSALRDLNRVIDKNASLPILTNVYVCMDSTGRISMTALWDSDIRMNTTLQASRCEGSGVFLANAEQLINALKGLPKQDVTLTCERDELRIKYEGGSIAFLVVTDDEEVKKFPFITRTDSDIRAIMRGKILVDGIASVQFAVGKDTTRPVMTGVLMERVGDRLTFNASDGRVLKFLDYKIESSSDFRAIIPTRVCDIIRATIKSGSQVFMQLTDTHIYLDYDNTLLDVRLIEGKYPNYRGVVPKSNPHHIEVDRQTLLNCVKRVSLFANSTSKLVELCYKEGKLSVSGRDDDLFTRAMTESIDVAKAWSADANGIPEPLRIGLSATFLTSLLMNFGGDSVELQILDNSCAVVFSGDSSTTLLMPMMLDEHKEDKPTYTPETEEDEDVEDEEIEDEDESKDVKVNSVRNIVANGDLVYNEININETN